jgi:CubicO group peptidase (beta-lactamase class C family)
LVTAALAQHPTHPGQKEPDSQRLHALLDPIMEMSVVNGDIPGGVLLIGHNGRVVYRQAFGWRALDPQREPMTADTVFDLASLTKCIATTTAILKLVQDGRVSLNDPVTIYLPDSRKTARRTSPSANC